MADNDVDDFLAHYGVPGMKWGKRNAETGVRPVAQKLNDSKFGKASAANVERHNARVAAKKAKPTSDEIHGARHRQAIREQKYQEAEGDLYVARTNKGKDKAEKVMRKLEKDLYDSGDAATALKMTKGEKVAAGLGLASVALYAIAIGGMAANSKKF